MLSRALEKTMKDFIAVMNQAAKEQAEQIADVRAQTIYTEDYKNAQETKIRTVTAEVMQTFRDSARNAIMSMFENGRAAVENSVAEGAHDAVFEEIKNAAEATGGDFTEYEINVLLEKCAGHYFAMKLLARLTADHTNAAAILKERFKMPNPQYYLDLFDTEENYLLSFIQSFKNDGAASVDFVNADVNGETLISGTHFSDLHDRLEVNPNYLTDDDISAPALRSFERRTLRESGIVLDVNDTKSKQLVKEATRKGGTVKNMLVRTCWKSVVDEELKEMWEDAQINAQIKYGAAGKTAYSSTPF